jgi:hypothetical protein
MIVVTAAVLVGVVGKAEQDQFADAVAAAHGQAEHNEEASMLTVTPPQSPAREHWPSVGATAEQRP